MLHCKTHIRVMTAFPKITLPCQLCTRTSHCTLGHPASLITSETAGNLQCRRWVNHGATGAQRAAIHALHIAGCWPPKGIKNTAFFQLASTAHPPPSLYWFSLASCNPDLVKSLKSPYFISEPLRHHEARPRHHRSRSGRHQRCGSCACRRSTSKPAAVVVGECRLTREPLIAF